MRMKGLELTATMLATIIFVVLAIVVILLLWGSFVEEAGGPVSTLFFKLFDWFATFLS